MAQRSGAKRASSSAPQAGRDVVRQRQVRWSGGSRPPEALPALVDVASFGVPCRRRFLALHYFGLRMPSYSAFALPLASWTPAPCPPPASPAYRRGSLADLDDPIDPVRRWVDGHERVVRDGGRGHAAAGSEASNEHRGCEHRGEEKEDRTASGDRALLPERGRRSAQLECLLGRGDQRGAGRGAISGLFGHRPADHRVDRFG